MSAEHIPADPVTLADLKKALSEVRTRSYLPSLGDDLCVARSLVTAWRTAFEWHLGLHRRHTVLHHTLNAHLTDFIAIDREEDEGMLLIREKLQS